MNGVVSNSVKSVTLSIVMKYADISIDKSPTLLVRPRITHDAELCWSAWRLVSGDNGTVQSSER